MQQLIATWAPRIIPLTMIAVAIGWYLIDLRNELKAKQS